MKFLIGRLVKLGAPLQVFSVDASSLEEAEKLVEDGSGEFEYEELGVQEYEDYCTVKSDCDE